MDTRTLATFADTCQEKKVSFFSAVPANTRWAYKGAVDKFTTWLDGRTLDDGLLAEYIRYLHEEGKSLSTVVLMPPPLLCRVFHRLVNLVIDVGLG